MMSKCYFCDKKAVICCDWCNHLFCADHFKNHTNLDCNRIEEEERQKWVFWEKVFK